ncbi:hypothetical protein [Pedobacter nanyangensis]|uniref:hypothetical protein n=1 Tax=Pedobacter nanyangensis TaxID=1562389 RepID=UPI0013B3CF58|nr:hypothetical protein [Pedobacter nanyangensis]
MLVTFFIGAQRSLGQGIKLENVVNEQFGTLLESLLKDGKIDEVSAKTYLETVFGYDEAVSNYLKTVNLSQQLKGLGQGKMSFDSYITSLNSSLISFIPQEKQQAYASYMQTHYMMEGAMNEIKSGKIGTNTVELASGIIQGLKESKELKLKNEAIAKKLEVITPTLAKLNSSTAEYKKLNIVDEVESEKNWHTNTNPVMRDKPEYPTTQFTTNYMTLQNGYLLLTTQNYVGAVFNWDKDTRFEPQRIYRNMEKFDFSKDFVMSFHLQMDKRLMQTFEIEIGKGYRVSIARTNGFVSIVTPADYKVTEKYGNLATHNDVKRKSTVVDRDRFIILNQSNYPGLQLMIREKKNPDVNFDGVLKLTISKKGNVFTCKLNDLPGDLTSTVNYFPDKYYLGAVLKETSKKAVVLIHKLELEHL